MKKTIVDYLEKTTQKFADKISFADDKNQATYAELTQHVQALITKLEKLQKQNQKVQSSNPVENLTNQENNE